MKLSPLKRFPIHVFLLPVFYVLHAANKYHGLFPLQTSLRYLAYYMALSIVVFAAGWTLLRSVSRAGIWSIIVLILFFFFGTFHDFLRGNAFLRHVAHYRILLPAIVVFIAFPAFYLKKTSRALGKITLYFNIIFIFFAFTEVVLFAAGYFSKVRLKNDLAWHNQPLHINLSQLNDTAKPDIFFIVFDEYASSLSLKKYLGFDNSSLDSSLSANGFRVIKNSKSNYNATPLSLASTFNLQYFNSPLEHVVPTPDISLKAEYSFRKSSLPQILSQQGYTIKNLGLLDLENHPAPEASFFHVYFETIFYSETLWHRIKKEIWWHVAIKFPRKIEASFKKEGETAIEVHTRQFKNILSELQTQSGQPKFVYGHIFMPHSPYYLNRHGKLMITRMNPSIYLPDSLYLEQLSFCNTWITALAEAANQPFKRPRVVVIEGDHGYRHGEIDSREKQFMNLNTFYFSDRDYRLLYDSVTPVNTFRIVFKKYFGAGIPLVTDSTILLPQNISAPN